MTSQFEACVFAIMYERAKSSVKHLAVKLLLSACQIRMNQMTDLNKPA